MKQYFVILPLGYTNNLFSAKIEQDKQVISTGLGLYICRMLLEKHGCKIFAVTNGQEQDKKLAIIIAYPTTSLS